jgi:regulator of ribonuclease activity A
MPLSTPTIATADLSDEHGDRVDVLALDLNHYGGLAAFGGPVRTVKCHEDNALVRRTLEGPGHGAVLVVDGGGSGRCALVGDRLAQLAHDNGWAGIIVYGRIRDSAAIAGIRVGVCALGTTPRRSIKRNEGQVDEPVRFGGVVFAPGRFVYADADGVIVADEALV